MKSHTNMSTMKIVLICFIFSLCCTSCHGALNVTEELITLKETVRLQNERIKGLQQMFEDSLQRNDLNVSSSAPQFLTNTTQRANQSMPEKSGNTKRLLSQTSIAFFAYMSNSERNLTTHHLLIFDHALLNSGNGYHPNSGVFIAPQTGIYVFIWTVRIFKQSILLIVNGVRYVSLYNRSCVGSYVGADESVTGFAVVHVNQGDDVYLRSHSTCSGEGTMFSNEFGRSTFGGWILH